MLAPMHRRAAGELQRVDPEPGQPPEGVGSPSKLTEARTSVDEGGGARGERRHRQDLRAGRAGHQPHAAAARLGPERGDAGDEAEKDGEGLALAPASPRLRARRARRSTQPVAEHRAGRAPPDRSGASETISNQAKARKPATAGQCAEAREADRAAAGRGGGGRRAPGRSRARSARQRLPKSRWRGGGRPRRSVQTVSGRRFAERVAAAEEADRHQRRAGPRRREPARQPAAAARAARASVRGGRVGRRGASAPTSAVSATAAAAPAM